MSASDADVSRDGSDAPAGASRREFLRTATRRTAGAALAGSLAAASGCGRPAARPGTMAAGGGPDWGQLERTLRGTLLRPDAAGYGEAIKIWNLRYAATRPAGVAMVADARDVATAIAWARDNRVEMVTRSGGHNYAGYSTTTGLVVNLNAMTAVSLDPASGNLTTVGAARNKDVAAAGQPHGRALPGGQCPTVGVAGFVLGGGLGFSMREHGLGVDSLLATEIVTADGKLLRASAEEHPDLFWALRGGGGGNFGVNTSFTFRTFAVPPRVTVFLLRWEGEAAAAGFLAFQEFVRSAPPSLGAVANFTAELQPGGRVRPTLEVTGQVAGSEEEAEKLFAPLRAAAPPGKVELLAKDFWQAKAWLSEEGNAPKPFAERSRFHPQPLPAAAVAAIVEALSKAPVRRPEQLVESSFFAWGGAVARVAPTATAFVHRRDVWLQTFNCAWAADDPPPVVDQLIRWQEDLYAAMQPFANERAFQNFPDPQLERPLPAYYGENLPRLIEVKQRYDPANVFRFAQSIPVR